MRTDDNGFDITNVDIAAGDSQSWKSISGRTSCSSCQDRDVQRSEFFWISLSSYRGFQYRWRLMEGIGLEDRRNPAALGSKVKPTFVIRMMD